MRTHVVHYQRIDGCYASTDEMSFQDALAAMRELNRRRYIDGAWIADPQSDEHRVVTGQSR